MLKYQKPNVGDRFGKWEVISDVAEKNWAVVCRCECGTIREIASSSLQNGKTKSCGCSRHDVKVDYTGQRFGRLVVLRHLDDRRMVECLCDCGTLKSVRLSHLRSGAIRSCGCLNREKAGTLFSRRNNPGTREYTDLTGFKSGRLTVIGPAENRNGHDYWKCACECGNEVEIKGWSIFHGVTRSCGCLSREYEDLSGQRFGSLIVLKRAEEKRGRAIYWTCLCDCGKKIDARATSLKKGSTTSCGCDSCKPEWLKDSRHYFNGTCIEQISGIREPSNKRVKTGTVGVCLDRSGKYRSYLTIYGKQLYLGDYKNLEDAVAARKKAEAKYFDPIIEEFKETQAKDHNVR